MAKMLVITACNKCPKCVGLQFCDRGERYNEIFQQSYPNKVNIAPYCYGENISPDCPLQDVPKPINPT
jgi:hypothetical protein